MKKITEQKEREKMRFNQIKTRELKNMAMGLYHTIFVTKCYGTKDLMNYSLSLRELEKRGFPVKENLKIKKIEITKK
ncbi:MAG: hypothetical protein QXN96_00905 [Candidatus Bathyarchaeia archaeon]